MRRSRWLIPVGVAALAVPLTGVTRAGAAGQANRDNVTVTIAGTESFTPNGIHSTYRFPAAATKVHRGALITFDNQTDDGHTMTLVASSDVPTSFNCPLCDTVNATYFPGSGPPTGFNIDAGVPNDDEAQSDADALDANGLPIEDFDTPGHTNGTDPPTVGDSTLVDANGSNNSGFPTMRTVQITAPAGTTLDYICTFHPWMHGTIQVVS